MSSPSRRHVAVIGAGAGGLSAARHLLEEGQEVTVFELGSHIGGLWVYDNDNGLATAYRSLHINSEPRVTAYRGFPFPERVGLFPSHSDVAEYLGSFADTYDIRRRIRFRTRVTSVEPEAGGSGRWWVEHEDAGDTATAERQLFDAVVVASGHQGVPSHPGWAKDFTGRYLHSHDYREPEPFRGERVLVVGVGNSGLDVAADVAPDAGRTLSAARSPVLIMPRMVLGVPTARVLGAVSKPWMPWPVQRTIMRAISRVFHGRMEQWGMRTPVTRTHPASNATFMAHVSYRRITMKPGVASVQGTTVRFDDGSTEEVDTIIAATGYEIDLPFLSDAVSPVTERRLDAYQRVVHPDRPGLYFVGFFNVSGGANISMMDTQSAWVAALVGGRSGLPTPSRMRADVRRERARNQRRFPGSPRYGLELEPARYKKRIAKEIERGGNPAPPAAPRPAPPRAAEPAVGSRNGHRTGVQAP
ncbi:MAG: FAD-dependent oxidoreductase [Pseudonocardia sediminis]